MSEPPIVVAVLGDLVRSRDAHDRGEVHRRLQAHLATANADAAPLDPLRVTVGDEFQGVFATMGSALRAVYGLRLALAEVTDVRFGLGRGTVVVVDATLNLQDGSAWWAARLAIESVERAATQASRSARRVGLAAADDAPAIDPSLHAAVLGLDALVAPLDARSAAVADALLRGEPLREVAERLGISASAVSQRVRRDRLSLLTDALSLLEQTP